METAFLVPTSLSDGGCVCVTGLPLEGTNTHPVSPWCELGLREALLSSAVCTDQTQAETEPHRKPGHADFQAHYNLQGCTCTISKRSLKTDPPISPFAIKDDLYSLGSKWISVTSLGQEQLICYSQTGRLMSCSAISLPLFPQLQRNKHTVGVG